MAETYHVITTWQVQLYCVERSETSQYGFFEISYEKRSWYCIYLLDHVTHRTQRGVWGDEVSPKIPFSGRGADVARAAPGKERFSACCKQANRPAFRLGRPVSMSF